MAVVDDAAGPHRRRRNGSRSCRTAPVRCSWRRLAALAATPTGHHLARRGAVLEAAASAPSTATATPPQTTPPEPSADEHRGGAHGVRPLTATTPSCQGDLRAARRRRPRPARPLDTASARRTRRHPMPLATSSASGASRSSLRVRVLTGSSGRTHRDDQPHPGRRRGGVGVPLRDPVIDPTLALHRVPVRRD